MKLVAEYLLDAIKFEQMAEDAKDAELKAAFLKQAADYRKLALKRAKQLGMPPPAFHQQGSGVMPEARSRPPLTWQTVDPFWSSSDGYRLQLQGSWWVRDAREGRHILGTIRASSGFQLML